MGLYVMSCYKQNTLYEGLEGNQRCPNMLIQIGSNYYLYNSNLAKVPGVNPVRFNNLEEYVEFIEWQKSQGISCPVLYLQKTYDTQGTSIYKIRPDPNDPEGGLPSTIQTAPVDKRLPQQTELIDAGRNDKPFNLNSYPGFDPYGLYIGVDTPLDKLFYVNEDYILSDNAMDQNWGGVKYSNQMAAIGHAKDNRMDGQNFKPFYIYDENKTN
tara:strand:+ start:4217 stop:4852 length:636 start_codon:yes stop_codon:yes gene_type:complete